MGPRWPQEAPRWPQEGPLEALLGRWVQNRGTLWGLTPINGRKGDDQGREFTEGGSLGRLARAVLLNNKPTQARRVSHAVGPKTRRIQFPFQKSPKRGPAKSPTRIPTCFMMSSFGRMRRTMLLMAADKRSLLLRHTTSEKLAGLSARRRRPPMMGFMSDIVFFQMRHFRR